MKVDLNLRIRQTGNFAIEIIPEDTQKTYFDQNEDPWIEFAERIIFQLFFGKPMTLISREMKRASYFLEFEGCKQLDVPYLNEKGKRKIERCNVCFIIKDRQEMIHEYLADVDFTYDLTWLVSLGENQKLAIKELLSIVPYRPVSISKIDCDLVIPIGDGTGIMIASPMVQNGELIKIIEDLADQLDCVLIYES